MGNNSAFDKYSRINPFPPVGSIRIWNKDYVDSRCDDTADLDKFDWNVVKSITDKMSYQIPETSGLYLLCNVNPYPWLINQIKFGYIVYVGKTENLRNRYQDYCRDKSKAVKTKASAKTVRNEIAKMFQNFANELQFYYSEIPYGLTHTTERVLIELCDPIFNIEFRLSEKQVNKDLQMIKAKFLPPEPAFQGEKK